MKKAPDKILTLTFLLKGNSVLLAMKKRGFGKGKWNGYGGKVNRHESAENAAVRELSEESGIKEATLKPAGILYFYTPTDEYWVCHVFLSDKFASDPQETEEMIPRWFVKNQIPFDKMWRDDPHWLPAVLSGKKIEGHFWFGKNWDSFRKYKVKIEK